MSGRPDRASRATLALLASPPAAGWRRYGIAVLAVAATGSLRMVLEPMLGQRLPFITRVREALDAPAPGGPAA